MAGTDRFLRGQAEALAALCGGANQVEAAAAAGVSERTVRRWLRQDLHFRKELSTTRHLALEAAATKLALAAEEAASRLVDLATAPASVGLLPPATRLRACQAVLEAALKASDQLDFEARLVALEDRLGLRDKGHR